jgi:3-dehydroquinate synthase
MEAMSGPLAQLEEQALETVIRRSAELHMNHIALGGDPFELGSARPLDFGHWSAHKLEQISGFRLGHGEAVAIGMAVDLIYARRLGLLSAEDEQRALSLIRAVGFDLHAPELTLRQNGELVIVRGLEEFREHLGGELTITLVTGIGRAVEVHEMDATVLSQVLDELTVRFGSAQVGPVSASRVA